MEKAVINNLLMFFQVEEMYKKAHAAIRADPEAKPAAKKEVTKKR